MRDSDKRALAMFEQARAAKAQADLKFELSGAAPATMPRVRLASDVDPSKADPDCEACGGEGVKGFEDIGGERVPVICRCVAAGGGVKPDKLDQMMSGQAQPVNRAQRRAMAARRRRRLN